jgi:hypothetical protein
MIVVEDVLFIEDEVRGRRQRIRRSTGETASGSRHRHARTRLCSDAQPYVVVLPEHIFVLEAGSHVLIANGSSIEAKRIAGAEDPVAVGIDHLNRNRNGDKECCGRRPRVFDFIQIERSLIEVEKGDRLPGGKSTGREGFVSDFGDPRLGDENLPLIAGSPGCIANRIAIPTCGHRPCARGLGIDQRSLHRLFPMIVSHRRTCAHAALRLLVRDELNLETGAHEKTMCARKYFCLRSAKNDRSDTLMPKSSGAGNGKGFPRKDFLFEIRSFLARLLFDHAAQSERLAHTDSLADWNHRARHALRPGLFENAKHGVRSWRDRKANARKRNLRPSGFGGVAEVGNGKPHIIARFGVDRFDFRGLGDDLEEKMILGRLENRHSRFGGGSAED